MLARRNLLTSAAAMAGRPWASRGAGPRLAHVASYHRGYPPSDEATAAFTRALGGKARLETAYLDAKRADPESLAARANELAAWLADERPDLIVASDDDAVGRILVPVLGLVDAPAVFWGVNWSADRYALPRDRVTGMVEVLPVVRCLEAFSAPARGARLVVLSENGASEAQNRAALEPRLAALRVPARWTLVADFDSWRSAYVDAQREADLVYLPTNGAIAGWDHAAACTHVARETKIPSFTCDAFMMAYALVGLVKVPAEQGAWAARAALAIVSGQARPAEIPWTENGWFRPLVNRALATRVRFRPPAAFARQARP